jgi:hypothetical protein
MSAEPKNVSQNKGFSIWDNTSRETKIVGAVAITSAVVLVIIFTTYIAATDGKPRMLSQMNETRVDLKNVEQQIKAVDQQIALNPPGETKTALMRLKERLIGERNALLMRFESAQAQFHRYTLIKTESFPGLIAATVTTPLLGGAAITMVLIDRHNYKMDLAEGDAVPPLVGYVFVEEEGAIN